MTKICHLLSWAVFCECFVFSLLQHLSLSCYSKKCQLGETGHAPLSKEQSSGPSIGFEQKEKGKCVVFNHFWTDLFLEQSMGTPAK